MSRPRWRKVLQDLIGNKTRTLLVVLAIAVGVFAVGMIAGTQSIIGREMTRNYFAMNAASALLGVAPFDDDLVASVARVPGVAAAEGRSNARVQVPVGNEQFHDLVVTGLGNFADLQVDIVRPDGGQWPPGPQQIVIERSSQAFLQTAVSQTLTVKLGDGRFRQLEVVGLAHDVDVPDAQFADTGFGYVDMDTLAWLGGSRDYTRLHLTVADGDRADRARIQAIADAVAAKLARSGHDVYWTYIPPPGEHWAEEIVTTLLLLLSVFGFLTLFLSGFLVVNTIAAILTQHVRQIGIMKIVGARRRQIVAMYLAMVVVYGVISLGLGVPLGAIAAQFFVTFLAGIINIEVASFAVPPEVLALEVGVGLLVPLLAALWPVILGVQVTIQKALAAIGLNQGYGRSPLDRLFARIQNVLPLERPLLISLRNTIRRKGRLVLTLLTLVLASAIFISVLSVRASLYRTVEDFLRYRQYDVRVSLDRPYRLAQLEQAALAVPGVVAVEGWGNADARRLRPDATTSDGFDLVAPPADTRFIDPVLMAGRWLVPGDTNAIVVNSDFVDAEPDVGLDSEMVLEINGRESTWRVVGIVQGVVSGPIVYITDETYARLTRQVGQASRLYVVGAQHDSAFQEQLAQRLSDQLPQAGIGVTRTRTVAEFREQLEFQFGILVTFLVIMAVLLAVVGALGLMATMSINVLERTREIGVMRAIGASDTAVRHIVLVEGVTIGLVSWLLGTLLALPLSRVLSAQVGIAFVDAPLSHAFSWMAVGLWLVIVVVLSAVASYLPARSAARLTIREVLAYE